MRPAFILVGHSRSGTQYMAKLMQFFCYDVVHERVGKDGISAMDALPVSKRSKGLGVSHSDETNRLLYKENLDTKTIHVVRNPWDVVESEYGLHSHSAGTVSGWFPEIAKFKGIDKVIASVVRTNRYIEEFTVDLRVRVEEAPQVMWEWLVETGLGIGKRRGDLPSTMTGHKKHKLISDKEWADSTSHVLESLMILARDYGYPDTISPTRVPGDNV